MSIMIYMPTFIFLLKFDSEFLYILSAVGLGIALGSLLPDLDYMFFNNSPVISAAPGYVEDIEIGYLTNSTIYVVGVVIRFNSTLTHQYAFEGNATTEGLRDQQVAMLDMEIGWSRGNRLADSSDLLNMITSTLQYTMKKQSAQDSLWVKMITTRL